MNIPYTVYPHTETTGSYVSLLKVDYPNIQDAMVYAVANGFHHIIGTVNGKQWYLKGLNEDPNILRNKLQGFLGNKPTATSWVF